MGLVQCVTAVLFIVLFAGAMVVGYHTKDIVGQNVCLQASCEVPPLS